MAKAIKRELEDENLLSSEVETTEQEVEKEEVTQPEIPTDSEEVVDVDLHEIKRKKFRINGDSTKVVEYYRYGRNSKTRKHNTQTSSASK